MEARGGWAGQSYQTVFCLFMVLLAFLWRDNPHLAYPQVLYLLLLLLLLNLGAGLSLRLWPARRWLSASIILMNCAVITALLAHSGGPSSNLWVLYLLPLYTTCIFLERREVVWITLGAVSFDALFHIVNEPVWSDAALFLVALKSGIFVFAAATTHAIVRRDRARASALALQRTRLESARRLAEAGKAGSAAAHDLKSPLQVILGTAEILLDHGALPAELLPDVARIKRSVLLCRELASGALGPSPSRGRKARDCGIHGIIDGALSFYRNELRMRGIRVETDLARDSPLVKARPGDLERVLLNLISNAGEAMPEGGVLTVRSRLRGPERPGGPPLIEVSLEDTGPGIPEDVRPRLFEPFATGKPGGTGLGLHLCQEIARRHGGSLRAEGDGGGARFVLSLPAKATPGIRPALAGDSYSLGKR